MFNYAAIDKKPSIAQVRAILDYIENNPEEYYLRLDKDFMMSMKRPEPNKILLELTNAHISTDYEVIFNKGHEIEEFTKKVSWIS